MTVRPSLPPQLERHRAKRTPPLVRVADLAAVLALLTPLLVLLPIFEPSGGGDKVSASAAGKLGTALTVLVAYAVAGVAGAIGARTPSRLRRDPPRAELERRRQLADKAFGKPLVMAAALAMLALTIFTVRTLGPYLFAPAVLMVIPALWLQRPR